MKRCLAIISVVCFFCGNAAGHPLPLGERAQRKRVSAQPQETLRVAGPQSPASYAVPPAAAPGRVIDQYCITCHSERAKAAGMDSGRKLAFDTLDIAHVNQHAETWEKVVRKLRAGM